jgi:hypothetical protein
MHRFAFFLIPVVASAICSTKLSAQSEKINLVAEKGTTEIPVALRQHTWAVWSGGALLMIEDRFTNSPRIHVIDREGKDASQFDLTIPNGGGFLVGDWGVARGLDGVITVVGMADFPERRSGFLGIISPDGNTQKYIQLWPFRPDSVTVAADGKIWVVGTRQTPDDTTHRYPSSFCIYDQNGKLLDSFIPDDGLETERQPGPTYSSVLIASNDRVAWYSKNAHTYSEFALDGRLITRVKSWTSLDKHPMDWLALCEDDGVFVGEQIGASSKHEARYGIFVLDRQSGDWNFTPSSHVVKIFGCEGTRLATTSDYRSISWLAPRTN